MNRTTVITAGIVCLAAFSAGCLEPSAHEPRSSTESGVLAVEVHTGGVLSRDETMENMEILTILSEDHGGIANLTFVELNVACQDRSDQSSDLNVLGDEPDTLDVTIRRGGELIVSKHLDCAAEESLSWSREWSCAFETGGDDETEYVSRENATSDQCLYLDGSYKMTLELHTAGSLAGSGANRDTSAHVDHAVLLEWFTLRDT